MPRVTVLTPVHNGARYLDQSIESVMTNGYDDLELIAIDDGSTDGTAEILARWAARDPRVVVLRFAERGGPSRALNAALTVARGEFLARQDADDVALPGRFAKQVAALDADRGAVLVAMERAWIDARGKRLRAARSIVEPPEVIRFLLHFTPAVAGIPGQTMIRTAAARAIGGWNEAFLVAQGWEFSSRLSAQGRFITMPDEGMLYRLHPEQVTRTMRELQLDNALLVTQRMLSTLLERNVTDEEAAASASVWCVRVRRDAATLAERIFREAFARFRSSAEDRQRARHIAKAHFARAAARHARRGELRDAALHLVSAVRL